MVDYPMAHIDGPRPGVPPNMNTVVSGLAFAEGPRWHDGVLWFSDIQGGAV